MKYKIKFCLPFSIILRRKPARKLIIEAADFITLSEEGTSEINDELNVSLVLHFSLKSFIVDSLWGVEDERVYISSSESGVVEYSEVKKTYIHHYYGRETVCGDFLYAEIDYTKELAKILKNKTKKKP